MPEGVEDVFELDIAGAVDTDAKGGGGIRKGTTRPAGVAPRRQEVPATVATTTRSARRATSAKGRGRSVVASPPAGTSRRSARAPAPPNAALPSILDTSSARDPALRSCTAPSEESTRPAGAPFPGACGAWLNGGGDPGPASRSVRMAKPSVVPVLAIALLPAILGAAGREDRPPGPSSRVAPGTAPGPPAGPPWLGRYEENRGQAPPWVRYLVRTGGLAVALTDSGAVFALRGPRSWTMLRMGIEGAAPGGGFRTREPLPGRSHHLRGRDPARWVRGVPAFGRVERRGIRPGVDLVWRLEGSTPAYDLVVAPGADPGALVLRFEGASSLGMERDGTLAVGARCGVLRHGRPIAYQEAGGVRRGVPVAFEARGPARAGFRVGRHDPSLPLVIDPLISYASYFGGSGADPIRGLAPGPGGSILVAVAGWDAFVARLAPGGARLEFATYLGGADDERTAGIALDASGGAWVSGTTKSADFPVWVPHQGTRRGVEDAFLLRLEPPGDALAFSTYFGGASGFGGSTAGTSSSGVAVLPGGGGVLVGTTSTVDLPVLAPFQESYGGWYTEGFVAAFSDEGVLAHSSFLGGSHYDGAEAVAVDADGAILVAGWTWSADFPQAGGVAGIRGPGTSAFVAKVPAGGGSLAWCQAFGGSGTDSATAVAALPSGDVCVAGSTDSADFPEVAPLGDGVGFLSIFSAAGDALELSTGLVGSPDAVAPDADGGLFLAGSTGGLSGFLVSPLQDALSGVRDAFLARIAPDRSGYTFSTYVGGTGTEDQAVLAVEDADHAWIAFQTTSQSMPVKSALQPAFGGGTADPFLVRVTMAPGPPTGLTAVPLPGRKARLEWYDDSDDEAGFEIQRKTGAGAFATVASIPGERGSYEDPLLQPLTAYSYRVRALRIGGPSPWSDEAVVTTFDVAPFPPTGVVVAASASSVHVTSMVSPMRTAPTIVW